MHALARLLRWIFPRGEFWERPGFGFAVLAGGLLFLFVAAVCVVIPLASANTIRNDTSLEAHCRESVGKPDLVIIKPGHEEDMIDTYDCAIYDAGGGVYRGCLIHSTRDEPVLVSEYQPGVPEPECDVGIYPAR